MSIWHTLYPLCIITRYQRLKNSIMTKLSLSCSFRVCWRAAFRTRFNHILLAFLSSFTWTENISPHQAPKVKRRLLPKKTPIRWNCSQFTPELKATQQKKEEKKKNSSGEWQVKLAYAISTRRSTEPSTSNGLDVHIQTRPEQVWASALRHVNGLMLHLLISLVLLPEST